MNRREKSLLLMTVFAVAALLTLTAQVTAPTTPPANSRPKPPFKEEELASMLAPIALYPDTVISTILMAATYPLEVVEAQRWLTANTSLKGEALAKEAQKQPWDKSVQALVAVPDVLKMMDERLDWTQKVGDAVLAQQKEVLAMIQTLRKKAQDAGNLKTDDHMKVTSQAAPAVAATAAATTTVVEQAPAQVIVIESANPEVVYVPTYSSTTVYGAWGYPAYPPYYYPPPMGYPGSGFWWGVGIGISIGYWGGGWNNNCDWNGGNINTGDIDIDIGGGDRGDRGNRPTQNDRGRDNAGRDNGGRGNNASNAKGGKNWSHNPEHRKGVSYRDNASASKFDKTSKANAASRDSFRGRDAGGGSSGYGGGNSFGGGQSRDLGTSPSTGARGSGGASAGTRDVGSSRGSTPSAGTSNRSSAGSSSRGSSGGSSFSGMNSGSRASSFSSRGGSSRGGGGGGGRRR
jgi:hypothetical protein